VPTCLLLLALSGLAAQERPDVTARSAAEKRNGVVDPTYHTPMPHLAPPKETPAPAHWIWLGPVAGDQQVEARTTFNLASKPRSAQVWVTADDAFTLFLNGKKVEESPSVEQGWTHAHQRDALVKLPGRIVALTHSGKYILRSVNNPLIPAPFHDRAAPPRFKRLPSPSASRPSSLFLPSLVSGRCSRARHNPRIRASH